MLQRAAPGQTRQAHTRSYLGPPTIGHARRPPVPALPTASQCGQISRLIPHLKLFVDEAPARFPSLIPHITYHDKVAQEVRELLGARPAAPGTDPRCSTSGPKVYLHMYIYTDTVILHTDTYIHPPALLSVCWPRRVCALGGAKGSCRLRQP